MILLQRLSKSYKPLSSFKYYHTKPIKEAILEKFLAWPNSLEEVVVFAKQSAQVVAALQAFRTPLKHVPLLSPNKLQYRFSVSNYNTVSIINRNSYYHLEKALLSLDRLPWVSIFGNLSINKIVFSINFCRGPIGVEKSHTLDMMIHLMGNHLLNTLKKSRAVMMTSKGHFV